MRTLRDVIGGRTFRDRRHVKAADDAAAESNSRYSVRASSVGTLEKDNHAGSKLARENAMYQI